jgi:antitoxin (DNA-binding transcriptional repressor) of toxin-antitoxin stability system
MLNVTLDEIQHYPSKYLRRVEAGGTFIILQADKPIAGVSAGDGLGHSVSHRV